LKDRGRRGKWVGYSRNERIMIGPTQTDVIKECNRRGLTSDEYDVFVIDPQGQDPEQVDYPSAWR